MAERNVNLNINVNGNDQLNDVNKNIQKANINAAELAENTIKLTKGIAGGFELASQAAGVFGEKNAEAFEKTIARATQYVALSNALKDVAEGFGKANISALAETVKGFTKAGIGAKLFGNTTRIAIASTGIGLLLVALGAVVANWELIVEKVNEFTDSIPFIKQIKDEIDRLGGVLNIIQASFAGIIGLFKSGTSAVDEFNKAIAEGIAEKKLEKQLEAQEKLNKENQRAIELLRAQGGEEQKIFELRRKNLNDNIKLLEKKNDLSDEELETLENYRQQLKLLDIEEKKFRLDQQKRSLDRIKDARKEQKEIEDAKAKELLEQIKAEEDQAKRIRDIKIKLEQNEYKRAIDAINANFDDQVDALDINSKRYTEEVLLLNDLRNQEIKKQQDRFSKEQSERQKLENEQYINQFKRLISEIGASRALVDFFVGSEINEDGSISVWVKEQSEELQAFNQRITKTFYLFGAGTKEAEAFISELNNTTDKYNQTLEQQGFRFEVVKNKLGEYSVQLVQLTKDQRLALETSARFQQINEREVLEENLKEYKEYLKNKTELTDEEQAVLNEIRDEEFAAAAESIIAYGDLASQGINAIFDRLIFRQQQALNQLAFDQERVNNLYEETVNNRRALEEELETAEGARRVEILNSIKAEANAEKQLAAEREKLRRKEIDIQNKIAMAEYRNAVINAAILTAQAILNALQTVPPASFAFAAVAAAISAIQTGVVIANKPQPIQYASGGYTDGLGYVDSTGHEVAGVVHANEYVVPSKVLNTSKGSRMVETLEAMRKGGKPFADGGFSTTPAINSTAGAGTEALISALRGLQLQVAVTEINQVQSQVAVTQDRASV